MLLHSVQLNCALLTIDTFGLFEEIKKALNWVASLNVPRFGINTLISIFGICVVMVWIIGGRVEFGKFKIITKGILKFKGTLKKAKTHSRYSAQKGKLRKQKIEVRVAKRAKGSLHKNKTKVKKTKKTK
jgi:hypothetical protein